MPRTKTVFDAREAGEPQPQGATFLERALERALSSLDRDAERSAEAREAAKAALAAALTCEIRDVLADAMAGGPAPRARQVGPARMFVHRAEAARPGYFHEPAAVIG